MEPEPATREIGTLTPFNGGHCPLQDNKYSRCELLNVIQHIDIYGRSRASYVEQNKMRIRGNEAPISVTAISTTSRQFSSYPTVTPVLVNKSNNTKLNDFTITTKVSGLWPGNDILSKKARKRAIGNVKSTLL